MRGIACIALALAAAAGAYADGVTPFPKPLQNGIPLKNLGRGVAEDVVYKITVPPQAASLIVSTNGGSGDVDLFVRRDAYPTVREFDDSSEAGGTNEIVQINQPTAGDWYILLDAPTEYEGVRLTATYTLERGAVPAALMIPGPGIYSERATVRLRAPAPGVFVRYTTDGSTPNETSRIYRRALRLSADTQLRTKTFSRAGVAGPESEGTYQIHAAGVVETLANSVPVHHLAGVPGTSHLFRITVPPGANKLVVHSEDGPGDSQIFVRRGAAPTARLFDGRNRRLGNLATVTIESPAAGDWFIRLSGRTSYSGVSLFAYIRTPGLDLIAWQPALAPYIRTETFGDTDCEVVEGLIEMGTHRLLRFGTESRNIGESELVMPSPVDNPLFEFAACHGHYHFKGFARYRLLDSGGTEVATGRKVSFCLLDVIRWDENAAATPVFDCANQGIQPGWADIYDSVLPGQWIDITNVAPGTYTLEVTMNPDQILAEDDYTNNTTSLPVVIPAP